MSRRGCPQWGADLERVYFVGRPSRDPAHEASLRRLVERLRPVWVVIDTWSHDLQLHRVEETAGPGEQWLLIGEVISLACEFGSAFAVSHHNRKNPSATAIGAAVDRIVSVSRTKLPRARRLTPSGRWPEEPLTVVLEPGVGYELAPDLEEDEQARADGKPPARPLTERVLLHLLRCDPLAGPASCEDPRSLRRRKTDATIVGEPPTEGLDVDSIPPLRAGPVAVVAAGRAGVAARRPLGAPRQRSGGRPGSDGVLRPVRGGRSSQRAV